MARKYKKSASASIIKDTTYIASKLSWKGSLVLGILLFVLFYFLLPSWLNSHQADHGHFQGIIDAVIGRRINMVKWLGIVCGLLGIIFAIKSYFFSQHSTPNQRRIISFLAKLIGRNI